MRSELPAASTSAAMRGPDASRQEGIDGGTALS